MLVWMMRAFCLAMLLHAPTKVDAHQFNFGSVTISETQDNEYTVYFRYSASKATLESSNITFPAWCMSNAVVNNRIAVNSLSIRYTVRCQGDLQLALKGLDPSAMVYLQYEDARSGDHFEQMTTSPLIDVSSLKRTHTNSTTSSTHASYFLLGVEHILSGIDHLMVVLCYVCIFGLRRKLVWVITAFTLGHSLTLVLSAMRVIRVDTPPIEACIALSIVFLAREVLTQRHSPFTLLSATFIGLIHGLGFASALRETLSGLGGSTVVSYHWHDLLQFNLGIELGQMMFIAVCFIFVRLMGMIQPTAWRDQPVQKWVRAHQLHMASTAIGSAGVFMLLDRVVPWIP